MASLTNSAERFLRTFPDAQVDRRRLDQALDAFDVRKAAPMTRLTNLAGTLLLKPLIDDLAVPFANELLATAVRRMGADAGEAEAHAVGIIEGIVGLGERPLFGLQISIGAPRRSVPVTMLSRLDQVIESIHAHLTEAMAHPVGPQEHGDGMSRDGVPSDQWEGHVTDSCVPTHRHDALLVLPGRSIGVGESVAIAGNLQVPVFAVEMPLQDDTDYIGADTTGSPEYGTSCRIKDPDVATPIRTEATTPVEIAGHIVAVLEAAVPKIRRQQRTRMRYMLELGQYRSYLAHRRALGRADATTRRRVTDPFEFASLSELQRDTLAEQIGALARSDYDLIPMLGPEARAGFHALMSSADSPDDAAGRLLRRGLREMAQFADEPLKAARPFVWDEDGWRRLSAKMRQK